MEKQLLFSVTKKDLRIDKFRAGGKGGQHQNKTETGVRITHLESGAVGESREFRSQPQNQQAAFRRMAESEKFEKWRKFKASQLLGIEDRIQKDVERAMQPKNIRTEVKDENGKWVETNLDE